MTRSESPREARWLGVACVGLVLAAYALAAACRVGWTWDGSFLFFRILEDAELPVPHERWSNVPPMMTLAWASRWIDDLDTLAFVWGASYFLFAFASFALGVAMLRGPAARLRPWIAIGVLFVPLPGAMCPTMEVTPCLQLAWPLLAWIWAGYPREYFPLIAVVVAALWGLHPVAAPVLAMVAAAAWWHPQGGSHRRAAASLFTLIAITRTVVAATSLDSYEREQLEVVRIFEELASVTLLAPVVVVVVVLAWALRAARRHGGVSRAPVREQFYLWSVVFAAGVWFMHDAAYWSGSFNYRKFGVVAAAPFVWLAARDARSSSSAPSNAPALWLPCVAFAGLLVLGSSTWRTELHRLRDVGNAAAHPIIHGDDVPGLVHTPLYHWSGTVTSILVQGRRPAWVLLAHGVTIDDVGIRLWTSEVALPIAHDGRGALPFDLSRLRPRSSPCPRSSSCRSTH